MAVRRGRDEYVPTEQYAHIDLFAVLQAIAEADRSKHLSMQDALDPDRLCKIFGVTEEGSFDKPEMAAFGEKLFTNHSLGVDLLVVPPNAGFPTHVHPGHHLLLCLSGRGTFSLDNTIHQVKPGYLAMVEGDVPHAVGNPYRKPHVLLAFGSPHKELDSEERMKVVDWNGQPLHVPDHEHEPV